MSRRIRVAIGALVAVAGCRLESRRAGDSAATARDVAAAPRGCGAPVIDSAGVGGLRVGTSLDSVRLRCDVVRDTVERRAEGMPVRVLTVAVGGTPVEAEIAEGRVWRINVTTRGPRTVDSLGVGTPLRQLIARFPEAIGAHGEGGVYMPSARCGLGFRLTSPGPAVAFRGGTAAALRGLPDSTVVTRVLVTGCATEPRE